MPVVTVLPANLWLNAGGDGTCTVAAAVSKIGAMDAGPIEVELHVDARLLKRERVSCVPDGDNLKENQVRIQVERKL
jgi:hypothetical protein